VTDLDPIPFADADAEAESKGPAAPGNVGAPQPAAVRAAVARKSGKGLWLGVAALAAFLHGWAIWWGLGGFAGLTNGWPLWRDDHPLYYHSALVTRSFLKSTWTTAGYDPSFMAGYAKSVVFPASSTLPELVIAAFGGKRPELAYKLYVLVSAGIVPALLALSGWYWRRSAFGIAVGVLLYLLYAWTDYPINYVELGMVPYFLGIPLALAAAGAFSHYLASGGFFRWVAATALLSLAFLVHLTTAMVLAPAIVAGYFAWILVAGDRNGRGRFREGELAGEPRPKPARPERRPPGTKRSNPETRNSGWRGGGPLRSGAAIPFSRWRRHVGVWMVPFVVLAANAFWWWPGIGLASTKGPSGFAFAHPEGVAARLLQVITVASPIEAILIGMGLPGLYLLVRRTGPEGWVLVGFAAGGFFWGYLAGAFRALDFLQPGRHTYALFTALAVAAGTALDETRRRLVGTNGAVDRLDRWILAGGVLVVVRVLGYPMIDLPPQMRSVIGRLSSELNLQVGVPGLIPSVSARLFAREPFLSSKPTARLRWVVERVRQHFEPGERLLYEEGGFGIPGLPDPYAGGRFSGLLPEWSGIELIGGPYLHASLTTNFTQFGEGKLFGRQDWDRDFFVRYGKLYRPQGILCWTPHARRFCKENPDLVHILDDDGSLLVGRVVGFEGGFISGSGEIHARPGRIQVRKLTPDLDGSVVLRYHSVPGLVTSPSVASEPEIREDDPVPFLRLRPTAGVREVDIDFQIPGWP
jgi:hypothetical protein